MKGQPALSQEIEHVGLKGRTSIYTILGLGLFRE